MEFPNELLEKSRKKLTDPRVTLEFLEEIQERTPGEILVQVKLIPGRTSEGILNKFLKKSLKDLPI